MNAAIYARVSTDQQAEKGYSLDTQLQACRKCAEELGATKLQEYVDDGFSAEFIERPALARLRSAVKAKEFDLVVFYDPDRMARNLLHQLIIAEEIDKSGAELKFVIVNYDQSPDGRFMFGIRGLLAQLEKEKIKERTMRGKRGKVSKGMVISDSKPFGYIFDRQRSTYRINPTEAEIVKMVFRFLVNDQMGTVRICKELNARGIASPRGKKAWAASSVHRILTNTIYKGIIYSMKYRYEKIGLNQRKRTQRPELEWIPLSVPAIVDEATWEAAQQQLRANKNFAKRNLKHGELLNGLAVCAKCGRSMVISYSGGKQPKSYYTCPNQNNLSNACTVQAPCLARQIPAEILDEHVFHYLLKLSQASDAMADYIQAVGQTKDVPAYKAALTQMANTEQELLNKKNAVLRWFRQKMLTETEAENQLQTICGQLRDIAQMKQKYEAALTACSLARSSDSITAAIKMRLCKPEFSAEKKRAALRAVLDKVWVERTDSTRGRGSRPELMVHLKFK